MNPHIALLLAERHVAEMSEDVAAGHQAQERRRARRAARRCASSPCTATHRAGVVAMLAGAALVATALYAVDRSDAAPAGGVRAAKTNADQWVEPDISVTSLSYAPGHTSGWHVHPGVHSVVVLTGVLTVFDEGCTRQEFGSGSTYLGGRQPHLARNDAADDLTVVVTSIYDASSATGHGAPMPVPAGCEER